MVRFRDITVSRLSSGTILWIEEAGEIKTGTMTYDNAIPRVPRERNSIFVAVPTRNVDCVPAISASEGKIYLFLFFFSEKRIGIRTRDELKLISCYFIDHRKC